MWHPGILGGTVLTNLPPKLLLVSLDQSARETGRVVTVMPHVAPECTPHWLAFGVRMCPVVALCLVACSATPTCDTPVSLFLGSVLCPIGPCFSPSCDYVGISQGTPCPVPLSQSLLLIFRSVRLLMSFGLRVLFISDVPSSSESSGLRWRQP